ncbi:hypothetical protein LTR85_008797 [Meristemomyces frigidus]|nr:hypothetical protein LTR85_008797 [Meristemomyces frigidus]
MQDQDGRTALHLACKFGYIDTVQILLEASADPKATDLDGATPISLCDDSLLDEMDELFEKHRMDCSIAGNERRKDLPPSYDSIAVPTNDVQRAWTCHCALCDIIQLVTNLIDTNGLPVLHCRCSYHLKLLGEELFFDKGDVEACLDCNCETCAAARFTPCYAEPAHEPNCRCDLCFPFRYKGHPYYDDWINESLSSRASTDSSSAANALHRAGFYGKASYMTDPNPAWAWAMNSAESLKASTLADIITLLLACGAHVEWLDRKKLTFLHVAAQRGDIVLADILLRHGANVNAQRHDSASDRRFYTPLMYTVWYGHAAMVRFLILAGAHLEMRDCAGMTALRSAVVTVHAEATAVLLAHAPLFDALDDSDRTPLQAAIQHLNGIAIELLLEAGADLELATKFAPTALLQAIGTKHVGIVALLGNAGANMHGTFGTAPCALIRAAQLGDSNIIYQLLAYADGRQDVHVGETGTRRTALHLIAGAINGGFDAAVRALVEAGANINAVDNTFSTPLQVAAKAGIAYNTGCLLHYGADKSWRNDAGKTALDLAIAKRHKDVVEVLGGTLSKRKKWFRRS